MAPDDSQPTGNPQAPGSTDELFGVLYRELHTLAQRHLARGAGATIGTTTLLHETYLNVAGRADVRFPDRARFLGYASRAMRGLIVDYARSRGAAKRGGEFVLVSLDDDPDPGDDAGADTPDLPELSDALDRLAALDAGLAELVDLHFFCGLSLVEIAALRGVTDRTVQRDWRKARLILHRTLRPGVTGPPPA